MSTPLVNIDAGMLLLLLVMVMMSSHEGTFII